MVLFVGAAPQGGTAQGSNGLSARIIPQFPKKTTRSYSPAFAKASAGTTGLEVERNLRARWENPPGGRVPPYGFGAARL
jgi:hypothetical protein